jgi:hypothetical protein
MQVFIFLEIRTWYFISSSYGIYLHEGVRHLARTISLAGHFFFISFFL